jgi:hypothetical protein
VIPLPTYFFIVYPKKKYDKGPSSSSCGLLAAATTFIADIEEAFFSLNFFYLWYCQVKGIESYK